ncbi:unnamed protein product [Rotaria sp. Silwood2]|nr:unnamed protein product [Rotaria sp. Silwood2]CAF3147829.1 unnamed protein product [Rotaria sp. Silwood2]CAF3362975.1 unnamed protein product [Rotaria sp. Silwood2]CAF3447779.1 unnamed protein product [Rotaria sp. Silwood2]CAF4333546.1 unnamed protein product [Rotaria sp. Silwood2]
MSAEYPYDKKKCSSERFLDVNNEPQEALGPLENYEKKPLVSLEEAVKPIEHLVSNITSYIWTAKENCKKLDDSLTLDEAAAVHLYTMPCLYHQLNAALRSEKREQVTPYYLYLKLVLTALWKLPSEKFLVYRGVKSDISAQFDKGKKFTWWGFTSCTSALGVLQSDLFLGKSGNRTMFIIECMNGKIIQKYSHFPDESEVLLLPCSYFEVLDKIDQGNGLCTIHVKQIQPPVPLIQSPLSTSALPVKAANTGIHTINFSWMKGKH